MQNFLTRLSRLETSIAMNSPGAACRLLLQGPRDLAADEAVMFLRKQGHALDNGTLNIIRCVIGAEDGRPVDLPLVDLTPRHVE